MASELDYVNYNFEDLVSQLTTRLKETATWKDTYRSGTGQMIIELYAYVGNLVLYNLERVAQEGYISTALNRSSVVNLVRLLGYTPKRAVSATGKVTFTLGSARTASVFIPGIADANTARVTTASGTKFVVIGGVSIQAGLTSVDARIIQGQKVEKSITSNGTLNQEYKLDFTDIENTAVYVSVDGTPWELKESFVGGTPTSKWFKVRNELDSTVSVVFGDNVSAQSPASSAQIIIRYIRTDGTSGNVYNQGLVNVIQSPIIDNDGVRVTDMTVSNSDPDDFLIVGGAPEETTDEIRYEAPRVFAAGDRLVTRDDYIAVLENYGSIATANAWGENEEIDIGEISNYDMFNRVKISLILQTTPDGPWTLPEGTSFLDTLSTYLRTKAQVTVKYTYIAAEILEVIPTLDVKVLSGYSIATITAAISTALFNQSVLGVTTKLGQSKRMSDLSAVVEAIPGVAYHHMYLDLYEVLTFVSGITYGITAVKTNLLPGTVKLYDDNGQFGVDDGSGVIEAVVGGAAIGTVVYSTGVISVDKAATGDVTVRYQVNEDRDINTSFNQICRFVDVDITDISYNI